MNLAISELDAAIIAAYILGVVLFGIWMGHGQRNVAGYLVGGRSLPWWAVLFSIVATETSTVTFLSIPGLAFDPKGGSLVFLQLTFGYILGRFVVVFLFLPHYFRGELFTAYQVLDRRFGGATKQTASLLFLVTRNLADGLRLYLTAIVLQHVLGVDLWVCITVVGATTILYTFLGGMKSVVWNDCVQFAIYVAGGLVAMAVILAYLGGGWTGPGDFLANLPGGWTRLAAFAREHGKFQLIDLTFDFSKPYTLWSGVFGGIFVALASHGTDQLMVQRYLSARNRREASWALGLSGFVVCAQFALFLLIGVGLACFYHTFRPETAFPSLDRVFPVFIVDHLPMGVVGVIVAAVFAAAMSTLSSSLNSSAAAAVNDFYLSGRKEKPSERQLLRVSRLLTVVFGLIQIGVGIAGPLLKTTVVESVMAIAGFTTGVVLGVFFLGVLTKRASQRGALLGLVGGLAIMTEIVIVIPFITGEAMMAWPWYAIVGSTITFAIGLAACVRSKTSSTSDAEGVS
ncbi:MAG TPA: sodium:solute symporter [Thermoguttaceae bacterium]|nr:sodium:solute symporter [Thermoguttaceae bacterium]